MATLREVSQVLMRLAAAIPHAPPLTKENYRMYHSHLGDLDPALLELAADVLIIKVEFFPSVGKLRTAAVDLLVQAEGVPSAGEAWGEVIRSFATHGFYRGSPQWSHPLIGKAVGAIGGYARLCGSTNATADRSQFRHAYESSLEEYREGIRTTPSIRERLRMLERGGIDVGTMPRDQELRHFDYEPLALAPPTNTRIDGD